MRRIKIALRNLIRYRLNSGIIVISLALGFACISLIAFFILKEYSVDKFQKNNERIYALQADDPFFKREKMYFIRYGAAEYMKNNFSEVEDFCRISNATPLKITVATQDFFDKPKVIEASSNFFDFFSYQLLINTPKRVLTSFQDIVISDDLAIKYFGTSNPVGQRIILGNRDTQSEMVISGIFKKPKESTQINFDMVKLIGEIDSRCYLRLAKNTKVSQLEAKFAKNKATIPIVNDGTPGTHYLKDMRSAYFDTSRRQTTENSRNKSDLFVAVVIAIMVLAVALFNYVGLINNRLLEKKREHAICRVNGSSKRDLITDFITEIAFLIAISFCLSIFLMIWVIPLFNQLTSSSITFTYIFNLHNIILLIGIPLLVLTASFLYAIIKIENSLQISMLKSGKFQSDKRTHIPVFNIVQLAISITLLVGSIVIIKQINYITNKQIGLNKDVLEIKVAHRDKNLSNVFKAELEKQPCIEMVSLAEASPVLEHWAVLQKYNDNGTEKQYTPSVFLGDQNYIKTLGIKILEGSDFSQDGESNKNKCIINESLAKLFPGQNLIGNELPGNKEMKVIGVAKDFHYGSLKEFVAPGYIVYGNTGFYLMAKPVDGQLGQAREIILKIWNQLIKDFPINMESIGDRYEWMHRENANYAKLIGTCCFLSVFLSMIGLFAVAFHTTRRRVKEIGIRKVNGARVTEVMVMLNKDIILWVSIAFVIASPLSWYIMHKWLQNFAYKTTLSWWIFVAAGAIALVIALLTVSLQSWRAATRNPVESLRYE